MEISNENNNENVTEITSLRIGNLENSENFVTENDGIENLLIQKNQLQLLDFKFILFILIIPLCISIISFIIVFIIFQKNSQLSEMRIFHDSYFTLDLNELKCHAKASSYYNTYLKRYMCVCNHIFTGNGISHCDSCGLLRKNNVLRIVGGVEAKANSWPMAVYLEQNYKNTYYFNNSYHTITKVRII